jgi:hypothetical protein
MRAPWWFAPVLGALLVGCSHAEPAPTTLSPSAAEGHRLYLAKCQMCHELVEPTEFTRAQWPQKFAVFAKRAKLNPDEYQEILSYLEESARP